MKAAAGVALYTIPRGHHMWPGTRLSHNDVAATDIMWSFFVAHRKRAAGSRQSAVGRTRARGEKAGPKCFSLRSMCCGSPLRFVAHT
jgi:hypothetical protein